MISFDWSDDTTDDEGNATGLITIEFIFDRASLRDIDEVIAHVELSRGRIVSDPSLVTDLVSVLAYLRARRECMSPTSGPGQGGEHG